MAVHRRRTDGQGHRFPRLPARWWLRWQYWAAFAGAGAALSLVVFALGYAFVRVPPVNSAADREATVFYYADGRTELGRIGQENRVSVPLAQVPPHVRNAVIAAEDRTFPTNSGVSVTGVGRAAFNNVTGGRLQGGSTISQQYVKNALLSRDRTVSRKVRELFVTLKLERKYSKDQILESYLNTIFFGRNAYGIEAASRAYFNKDVRNLSVAEGAMLAAVIRSPVSSDPGRGGKDRLERRWRVVLEGMVQTGTLTRADAAELQFPDVLPDRPAAKAGQRGYLIDTILRELKERGHTDDEIQQLGLRVVTTLDPRLQGAAEVSVAQALRRVGGDDELRAGLVVLDRSSARILAMYGGRDYLDRPLNNVTQVPVPAAVPEQVNLPLNRVPRLLDVAAGSTEPARSGDAFAPSIIAEVAAADGRDLAGRGRETVEATAERIAVFGRIRGALAENGLDQDPDIGLAGAGTRISGNRLSLAAVADDDRVLAFALYREAGGVQVAIDGAGGLATGDALDLPGEVFATFPAGDGAGDPDRDRRSDDPVEDTGGDDSGSDEGSDDGGSDDGGSDDGGSDDGGGDGGPAGGAADQEAADQTPDGR